MGDTRIRWANKSWNPATGCHKISAGCDHCYAFTLAERRRGTPAFPVGFDPMLREHKLRDPYKWKNPEAIFVNSMSDLYLGEWPTEFLDRVHDVMIDLPRHIFIVLTKRPRRMTAYLLEYMKRRDLDVLPAHIWFGVTIENDLMTWRADELRKVPTFGALTISAEPLLSALPSLNLDRIGWLIVGGESGAGFRRMADDWARDLRDRAAAAGVAFFFKQHSDFMTERGQLLDGERLEQRPTNGLSEQGGLL